jgi:trehalose 6-phosphate phosphatase
MRVNGAVAVAAPPLDLLSEASLFLDFDGTLVEIAETPDAVVVEDRLRSVIRLLLARLDGRVALISGRNASEVRALLDLPSLAIAGSHGLEIHMADGRTISAERPAALDIVTQAMRTFARDRPGLLVEEKPLGTALHYRQRPDAARECIELAKQFGEHDGLVIQTGKMMIELRAGGGNKGSALLQLMEEPAMAGTRPVFIGDDDTDEPAFLAVDQLGGAGILVGPERATAARFRLENVPALLEWLEAAAAA